jgi:hypothetical protein
LGDESSPKGGWGICAPALPEVLTITTIRTPPTVLQLSFNTMALLLLMANQPFFRMLFHNGNSSEHDLLKNKKGDKKNSKKNSKKCPKKKKSNKSKKKKSKKKKSKKKKSKKKKSKKKKKKSSQNNESSSGDVRGVSLTLSPNESPSQSPNSQEVPVGDEDEDETPIDDGSLSFSLGYNNDVAAPVVISSSPSSPPSPSKAASKPPRGKIKSSKGKTKSPKGKHRSPKGKTKSPKGAGEGKSTYGDLGSYYYYPSKAPKAKLNYNNDHDA